MVFRSTEITWWLAFESYKIIFFRWLSYTKFDTWARPCRYADNAHCLGSMITIVLESTGGGVTINMVYLVSGGTSTGFIGSNIRDPRRPAVGSFFKAFV